MVRRKAVKAADLQKFIVAAGGKLPKETWRRYLCNGSLGAFREHPKFPVLEPVKTAPYWVPVDSAKTMCIQWANGAALPASLVHDVFEYDPTRKKS